LVLIALAKNPDERYASASEFLYSLTMAAVGRVPEDSRPLPSTTSRPWPSFLQQADPPDGMTIEKTMSAPSRPKIAADISSMLHIEEDDSEEGATPLFVQEIGRSSIPPFPTSAFSDAAIGSIDPSDLSVSDLLPSAEESHSRVTPLPMAPRETGSGIDLDIDSIRQSGVPLPSWRPAPKPLPPKRRRGAFAFLFRQRIGATFGKRQWSSPARWLASAILMAGIAAIAIKVVVPWMTKPQFFVVSERDHETLVFALPMAPAKFPVFDLSSFGTVARVSKITLSISVTPPKARVFIGKQRVRKPQVSIPAGSSPVELRVFAPGYKTARLPFVPDQDKNLIIELESTRISLPQGRKRLAEP
jgi:hypothetical protein